MWSRNYEIIIYCLRTGTECLFALVCMLCMKTLPVGGRISQSNSSNEAQSGPGHLCKCGNGVGCLQSQAGLVSRAKKRRSTFFFFFNTCHFRSARNLSQTSERRTAQKTIESAETSLNGSGAREINHSAPNTSLRLFKSRLGQQEEVMRRFCIYYN